MRLKLESISIKILDAISQVLTVPLALDYLISKFLVLKSTNADSNSFHRDKCRTSNRTAYAKASLLLSRVTFMYYGFTKRRPVCSFSPYWKRKIKLTSIHKTKIKIPLSTTIVERKWQRYVTIDRVCFPSIRMDFIGSLMKPNLSNNIQLFGDEEKPFFSKHGFDHKWFFVEPNIHSCFL